MNKGFDEDDNEEFIRASEIDLRRLDQLRTLPSVAYFKTRKTKFPQSNNICQKILSAIPDIADPSLTMLPIKESIAQQDEATSTSALLEQGVEATRDSATSAAADGQSVLTSDRQDESKGDESSSMSERRLSTTLTTALEEKPKYSFKGPLTAPIESSEAVSDSDDEEGPSQTSRRARVKQQQEQHRAEHREKKKMLRRRRLMRETEEAQDAEPEKVNPFNALPHFEYLELTADLEVELPSELTGFGTMDLSAGEPRGTSPLWSLDEFNAENLANSPAGSDDQEVVNAAARMLEQINALPLGGLDLGTMSLPPDSDRAASESSRMHVQSAVLPNAMRDNFLCSYATCPVREMHFEGPYYYQGLLGDQDHDYFKGSNPPPVVWEAYDKVVRNISTAGDEEMVSGFWAWHVPPFCYIPENGSDDGFGSRPEVAGDAMGGDQDMSDA